MTLVDHVTLRAVVLPAEMTTAASRAERLLTEYGHEVASAQTPEQALGLLQDDTDLLIVDVCNSAINKEFVNHLADMPAAARPRSVVVFADRVDENLSAMRKRLGASRWHVLLKPLHMHGLLNVLRQLDGVDSLAKA
jgi:DNA-binding NtrC family response regulator